MTPETVTAIKEALAPLAESLGQTGQYTWEVVVKQQILIGTAAYYWAAFWAGIAAIWFLIAVCIRLTSKGDEWGGMTYIFAFLVPLVFVCFCAGFIWSGYAHQFNPEFYAIEFLVNFAKPAP